MKLTVAKVRLEYKKKTTIMVGVMISQLAVHAV